VVTVPAQPDRVDQSEALRTYRDQHLAVRRWSAVYVVPTTQYDLDMHRGYGLWSSRYATTALVQKEGWAIFRGAQRLDNLAYLKEVGAIQEERILAQKVKAHRRMATGFTGTAIAGGVLGVISLQGMARAGTEAAYRDWRAVSGVGIATLLGGAIAGHFPSSKAQKMMSDPTAIRDLDGLQAEIATTNARLADALGLHPMQALQAEQPTD
jgi:hypothetical protein